MTFRLGKGLSRLKLEAGQKQSLVFAKTNSAKQNEENLRPPDPRECFRLGKRLHPERYPDHYGTSGAKHFLLKLEIVNVLKLNEDHFSN